MGWLLVGVALQLAFFGIGLVGIVSSGGEGFPAVIFFCQDFFSELSRGHIVVHSTNFVMQALLPRFRIQGSVPAPSELCCRIFLLFSNLIFGKVGAVRGCLQFLGNRRGGRM